MKKLIQINTVCNGSTGNIMYQIQKYAQDNGYETLSLYGRRNGFKDVLCAKYGNVISFWIHVILTTVFDAHGLGSYFHTRRMVKRIQKEKPDIIHLHNIHGYYLNLPILFNYLKNQYTGKIVWTFHDCWPMTGHCPHFVAVQCNKWKEECGNCPNKKIYPISWGLDGSKRNYYMKKQLFTAVKDMVIICPSKWLRDIVKQSYLKEAKCVVVPNGIDLKTFYPREEDTVTQKYNLPIDKKIILGVASVWDERKGLKVFKTLANSISEKYEIVLVGLSKRQIARLPKNMIGIPKTESADELAQLYTKSTIFINPSKEESFSLVTIEAMACGTPVIAMDTSAPKELVKDINGILLSDSRVENYLEAIHYIEGKRFSRKKIVDSVQQYSVENMTNSVLEIYERILMTENFRRRNDVINKT